jgi:hypothetical protein
VNQNFRGIPFLFNRDFSEQPISTTSPSHHTGLGLSRCMLFASKKVFHTALEFLSSSLKNECLEQSQHIAIHRQ